MTYYDWNEFVTHCLSHDISEYQNITEKASTAKTLLVEKQSNKCCTAKQDDPNNSLQNVTEPQTFSSDDSLYQATITSPVYSSNCRPLSATMNYLSYNTTVSPPRPRDQYLAQSSFPHQQTFTLYHQKHQPLQQSSSHDHNTQPPKLIPISSLDYNTILCTTDHYYSNNSENATLEYSSQEVLYSQDQQLILQSLSQDNITQPPDLIRL